MLPPANEVCEGYVFTGVCLSTGGMSASGPRGGGLKFRTPGRHPPGRHTPPLGRHTPLSSACCDTVNKRAVRIPLECILIFRLIMVIGICHQPFCHICTLDIS